MGNRRKTIPYFVFFINVKGYLTKGIISFDYYVVILHNKRMKLFK